jgi:hypothetical protein
MSESSKKAESGAGAFSAQDAMEFMQRMWNPFAMPMPGSTSGAVVPSDPAPAAQGQPVEDPANPAATASAAMHSMMGSMMPGMLPFPNPAAMFAALNPVEVERKIGELRVIENWLAMSLNVMQMSIKTLELQLASLEALHATHAPGQGRSKAESKPKKA